MGENPEWPVCARCCSGEAVSALTELLKTIDAQVRVGLRWDPEVVQRARDVVARTKEAEANHG